MRGGKHFERHAKHILLLLTPNFLAGKFRKFAKIESTNSGQDFPTTDSCFAMLRLL